MSAKIYMFEFFIDQIIFIPEIDTKELEIVVKLGNILEFMITVPRLRIDKSDLVKARYYSSGKSIFFPSEPNDILSLENNLTIVVFNNDTKEEMGTAQITWAADFKEQAQQLFNNTKNIREINKYNIVDSEEKKIANIDINMILICYGGSIEVAINNLANSFINIPILIPKFGAIKTQNNETTTNVNDIWRPLFNTPHKQKRSQIDMDLMVYAQMSGIPADEQTQQRRLTAEYVNNQLCGHKECPGAIKFRDWGIGPLAPSGAGLGTVNGITDAKPCGLYGMSQAYGTMESYGAYGLFVNNDARKTKAKCDSPDCPYNNFFVKSKVEEEKDIPCCGGTNKNKLIKCKCKCCGKTKVKKYPSSCGDPNCPSVPKKGKFKCKGPLCPHTGPDPADNVPNQCDSPDCPYGIPKDPTCEGEKCPYNEKHLDKCCLHAECPTVNPSPKNRRQSGGADKSNLKHQLKPNSQYINSRKRLAAGADKQNNECKEKCPFTGSYVFGFGSASTSNWRSQRNLPNSCTDPNCSFMNVQNRSERPTTDEESTATDSTWGRSTRAQDISLIAYNQVTAARRSSLKGQDVIITKEGKKSTCPNKECRMYEKENCSDKECDMYKCTGDDCPIAGKVPIKNDSLIPPPITEMGRTTFESFVPPKMNAEPNKEAKIQRLSLLVNEVGQKMFVSGKYGKSNNLDHNVIAKNLFSTKQMLSDVVSFDDEDDEMIYAVARLLAQREITTSLNNFYMDDYFRESKLKERNEYAAAHLEEGDTKKVRRRRGPCTKDSCKIMKYKTCSECGGVSRSGATCDNTDVSFSYVSYSDDETYTQSSPTETQSSPTKQNENKKIENTKSKTQHAKQTPESSKPSEIVPHHRKRRSRFIYHCGEHYPGIRQGHKTCRVVEKKGKNIPPHMGWLWSEVPPGIRRRRKNWRPGMINTTVNDRIIAYRRKRGIPDPPDLVVDKKKKTRIHVVGEPDEESDEEILPKPTLVIQKKDGNYLITVNPLKDPKTLVPQENPYMKCKPMQFLITKPKPPPKPQIIARSQFGEGEGEGEDSFYENFYKECFCGIDKDDEAESSSSESELNIEFTTPAGLIYPEEMKRPPNIVHTETQFKPTDFDCKDCVTIFPTKYSKKFKNQKKAVKIKK